MQATLLLIRQHRRISQLLSALEPEAAVGHTTRSCVPRPRLSLELLPELVEELLNHLALEDHVFYAYAQKARGMNIKPARDAHSETKRALYAVVALPEQGEGCLAAIRKLREAFERHVAHDERVFSIVARVLQPDELCELGEDMAAFAAALGRSSRASSRAKAQTHGWAA
jgi:hypothetical protein